MEYCDPPVITFSSTGHTLSQGGFSIPIETAIWDAIPAAYKSMKWLVKVWPGSEATYQYRTYCDDDPAEEWTRNIEVTKTGVYFWQVYDPLDAYSLSWVVGGTETDIQQLRPDACDDPPDLTFSLNDQWTGTWGTPVEFPRLDYTGTDKNGDPISGSLASHGYMGILSGAITTSSTLEVTDTSVIVTRLRDWDGSVLTTAYHDRHYTGQETNDFGCRDLAPIIVRITSRAVRFQQVKYKIAFLHYETSAETVIEESEWIYRAGDDPHEIEFTPAHPGTVKVTALYRCSRKMPFAKLIAEQ